MKRASLAIAMGLFLFAFGSGSFGADKLKVGLSFKMAPEYYLPANATTEKGFWKDNALEAELVPFAAGAAFAQALAAGAIDLGTGSFATAVHLPARDVPVVTVSNLVISSPFMVYVRADSRIKEPRDLAGAKIGVPRLGATSDFLARAVARRFGIEKDVKIMSAGGLSEIVAALKTGALDAIVQPPTVVIELKVKGEIRQVANTADYLPKEWVEHMVMARKEFVTRNPEVTRRAVKALLQGTDYIKKNPRWAIDNMKAVSAYSEEGAKEIYDFIKFTDDGKISRAALENVVNFMVEWKIIPQEKVPPLDQLYTERFLR